MKRIDDPYYPVTPHRANGHLVRGDLHKIYWEDSGNEAGMPVIFCHGGPGGSNKPDYRRFIDAEKYRIVQFDQRGCGKSEPEDELKDNSLQNTIEDMEAIRAHLGIEKWLVVGGSWGSTLALTYSEAHPDSCLGVMLVSMWLCRGKDIHWWFHGVKTIFPELWDQFAEPVPEAERHDLKKAYCRRILGEDKAVADRFATNLFLYEEGFMRFDSALAPANLTRGPHYGRIFAHYATNDFFLAENQLIENAHKVAHLPIIVITGRYDMCTTPNNAYDLCKQLPVAEFRIIPGAGHYPTEVAMSVACVKAADDIYQKIIQRGSF